MTKPIIHLNGSGAQNLLEGYQEALKKFQEAREALSNISPHPRDYYVSPDKDAFEKAKDEHIYRLGRIAVIEKEIFDLGQHVIENS